MGLVRTALYLLSALAAGLMLGHPVGFAEPPAPSQLPVGERVVGGAATITRQPATMTIDQHTSRAAIEWQSFDIGSQARVDIRQPSADSVLLNRILGDQATQIFGRLSANGQVYLTNPNGFYFSPSASVNVGGLVATTHQLSIEDFLAGRERFTRAGATGRILNEGELKAAMGGYIALLAPEVRNHGVIVAELGTVALAAGEAYELRFDPLRRLEGLRVEPATIATLVENRQAVLAPGGLIVLSALGANQLQGSVVKTDGLLEASSLVSKGGRIILEGGAITLGAQSTTAATGATGGGEVFIGGGWQGSGAMHQAAAVTMEPGAVVDASATTKGDGGTVVLWSDVRNPDSMTQAQGVLQARGGAEGGNGGRIETSGAHVEIDGATVDAGAPQGSGGLWLIDPYNYTINAGAAGTIATSLGNDTSVTIDTTNNTGPGAGSSSSDPGNITVSSAITKSSGTGDATLTLQAHNDITVSAPLTATSGKMNVVLLADQDGGGAGRIDVGANISTNGGGLWMGGNYLTNTNGGTLWVPFTGAGALTVGDGYAAASASLGTGVQIGYGVTLGTGGGNVAAYGYSTGVEGNTSTGVLLNRATVTTGGGNLFFDGISNYSSGSVATAKGVAIHNSSIVSTDAGQLSIRGELKSTSNFTNGVGLWIGHNFQTTTSTNNGSATLSTTSGAINLSGIGADSGGSSWRNGLMVTTSGGGDQISIRSVSGAITLDGQANFSASTTDTAGLLLQTDGVAVTSQTGAITLRGSNSQETVSTESAIRFTAGDTAGTMKIGADGTNPYSGNILIEGDSIHQRNTNPGSGSISMQSTGGLTIQSKGTTFTRLSAGSGTLTFDDDWNFGTSLSGFTFGKNTNTLPLTLSNALSVAGPISLYTGGLMLNGELTSSADGGMLLKAIGASGAGDITVASAITKSGGTGASTVELQANNNITVSSPLTATSGNMNVVLLADQDGSGSGRVDVGANISTNGGGLWMGGNYLTNTNGITPWVPFAGATALTVGDGYAAASTGLGSGLRVQNGVSLTTLGGHLAGYGYSSVSSSGTSYSYSTGLLVGAATVTTGGGNLTFDGIGNYTAGTVGFASGTELRAGSTVTTGAGNLSIRGELKNTSNFNRGAGVWSGAEYNDLAAGAGLGDVSIGTTSGHLTMTGIGASASGVGTGWRHGLIALPKGTGDDVRISTVSGNLTLDGSATYASSSTGGDSSGLQFQTTSTTNVVAVTSQTGAITLRGSNSQTSSQHDNAIRLTTVDTAGNIRIGYDATNAYSGNILIEGDSIQQRNDTNTGSGSIAVQSTGGLTIQSQGAAFTQLRAGNSGALTFDDDWNFGTNLGSFTLGKSTNTLPLTLSNALSVAGPISLYGGNLTVNANLTSTANGTGSLLLKSRGNITVAASKTLQTNNSALTLWSDSDANSDGHILLGNSVILNSANGLTSQATGGGHLTLGGGTDADADGRPDGPAFSTTVHGIQIGTTNTSASALYSGGGDIRLKGQTSTTSGADAYHGIGVFGALTAHSGDGAVAIDGQSADSYGVELSRGLGTGTGLSITSSKSSGTAISVNGTTSAAAHGLVFDENSTKLLQATGGGDIAITGAATGSNYGVWLQNTNVLANTGDILVNGQSGGVTINGSTLGKKTATAVTSSSSDIILTGNTVATSSASAIDTTGTLTVQPFGTSFSSALTWPLSGWTVANTISGLTLGKSGNTADLTIGSATSVAGPITLYGGNIAVNANLTSSNTGDIFIKSNAAANTSIALDSAASILKTGGARSTLTLQADGRIQAHGQIAASGSTPMDMVLWSDYRNTGFGGVSFFNNVTTNGGHLWAGGSNSNGGSTTWNGLTVGDGPSVGNVCCNYNAMDLSGTMATGGGDVLLWAGNGHSSGIRGVGLIGAATINAGSGQVTIIGDQITGGSNKLTLNTTGRFTWAPDGGDFGNAFTWSGTTSGGNFTGTGTAANLVINGIANLGGLTIGRYTGTGLTGDTVLTGITNSNDISIGSATTIAGPISLYGGALAIDAPLTATGTNTITLQGTGAVTDGTGGYVVADKLALLGGAVTLDHASNNVGTLAASGVGAVTYADSNALTIGTVGATSGVSATGAVRIETLSGDLTVAGNLATTDTSASALMLNAGKTAAAGTPTGGNLLLSGSPAVTVGAGGRATLYSGSVSGSTDLATLIGNGSGRFRYNSDEAATNYTLALGTGLYGIYREQPAATITADSQTITYGDAFTLSTTLGGVNGDTVAQAFGTAPTVAVGGSLSTSNNPTAGSHTLTASGAVGRLGYAVASYVNGTLTVNQQALTYSGTAANKVYDGTLAASLTHALSGVVAGDTVTTASGIGVFADKNVGMGKTVAVSGLTISGSDSGNYSLGSAASTTANITAKALTYSGTAANKIYDGTLAASLTHALSGVVAGETVTTASGTGAFTDKNVGTGKTVAVSGLTISGGDSGNYSLGSTASTTANITAKAATVSGLTAANKEYDGTTDATVSHSGVSFSGVVAGDAVTASGTSGLFINKNVGTGKAVTLSGTTYGGLDVGNYTFTDQTSTTANITAKALTYSGTAANKVYDGTLAASLTHALSGVVAGETVTTASGTGAFADKNVGTGKTVAVSGLTISGSDSGNYSLGSTASTTANITAKALTYTGTAANKVYDGNTAASLTHALNGVVAGDTVTTASGTGAFADKNVGTGKTVAVSGLTISGGDSGNYSLGSTASTTATITTKAATVSGLTAANKVYDGTTSATVSHSGVSFSGVVAGDAVTASGTSGLFI
ncbi:MAG: filamentous hemagglutinin N-terminal domain-containing protein, partial [Nitrospira sp.]|nr:filamentous hemagglutinin N-terminal domain-containing protein [Nitrospira sp.]